jgi:hypothetical protein
MNARWFPAVALSLFAASACNPFHHDPAVQVSARDAMVNSRWHANLATPANLAGVVQMHGSASMTPGANGTSTIITLDLANAAPGGLHPWEAHYGQCGDGMDNGVFGMDQAYQPLKVDSDGHATGKATVSLETPEVGDYFVVIRASALNPETIVACGNLAPPTQ